MRLCVAMMFVCVLSSVAGATQYPPLTQTSGADQFVEAFVAVGGTGEPPRQPTVYDKLAFTLSITPSEGVTLREVELAAAVGPDFYTEWVRGGVKLPERDGRVQYSANLEPLAGGDLTIGPIEVVYTTRGLEGDVEHTLELEALHVTIAGDLEATEGDAPAGLKDRLDAPKGVPWGWIIGVGGVVAISAVALAAVAMRKKREALPPPPRPAHVVALEALEVLEGEGWLERGQVEPFLAKCSDILRRYIGARFGIDAPDRTTEEFLHEAIDSRHLSVGHVTLLEGFLTKIDLVKFAKRPATQGEGREAAAQARDFIEETAQQESAPVGVGA
ncbi:MAG: hypothetical protein KDA20_11205 [Phycisphaerales bacterium]|nr:hypothetical protein [Phycisphaerales bacterium]